eukprot:m.34550 g.34550  ORF g.34550 m.34550 type:complete len:449 (+) comp31996_c0_seq2:56-1402(+)
MDRSEVSSTANLSTPGEPVGPLNPAADPRKMRRIIAEDPEWSLATVPDLVELCISHIVRNFASNPILSELKWRHKSKVLELLSTEIPLKVTARLVEDEGYWERCCTSRWRICDTSIYGHSWKRMFFERHIQELIETFVPESSDLTELTFTLHLGGEFVRSLMINQLLPPIRDMVSKEDDTSDTTSDAGDGPGMDHLDVGELFKHISHLQEVHVTYGVKNCGMNFNWDLFQFTKHDCGLLSKSVKGCRTLRVLHLHRSQVDDDKARVLISHILDHPSLTSLDLSHNKISYRGARAIGKLLQSKCPLASLILCNNRIDSQGAGAIGHALQKNGKLTLLDLRLNKLADEGGMVVLKSLVSNSTLVELNLASNELGEASAQAVSEVAVQNLTLKKLILSCNKLGEDGGKLIQEGMEDNETIVTMDVRQTNISEESEYCINQFLKRNQDKAEQ